VAPQLIKDAKAKKQHTPMETIVKAFFSLCVASSFLASLGNDYFDSLPPENDVTGQICEASQDHVVNRDWIPYRASSQSWFRQS
jgi:hypothetical protein